MAAVAAGTPARQDRGALLGRLALGGAVAPDDGGGSADASDAGGDADAGGGGGADPWTSATCPSDRVVTPRLCGDPVTRCICDPSPPTCAPGHLCLGGACFSPGQRTPEQCAADGRPAGVAIDPGETEAGKTVATGQVNVEEDADGWALILPAEPPGTRPVVVRLRGSAMPPVADGDEVEAVTCLYQPDADGLVARTTLLRRGGELVLLAAVDATYVANEECLPQAWKPRMMDLNCPPVWDGDDPDTTCRVCRPAALAFPGNPREVFSQTVGRVLFDGAAFRAVVGERVQECLSTCCDETGERRQIPAALEFALLAEQ